MSSWVLGKPLDDSEKLICGSVEDGQESAWLRRYPFVSSGSVQSPRVDGIAVAASCRAYAAGVSPPSAFFGRSSL